VFSSRLLSNNVKFKIHETIIFPVVLYGCETWSLTLRKEHRLWVFENRVLRVIFGPNSDAMVGDWRKLHNDEFHSVYLSQSIITMIRSRRVREAGRVACMGRRGMHIGSWLESQKDRDQQEDLE
jgi:hypothetical protein